MTKRKTTQIQKDPQKELSQLLQTEIVPTDDLVLFLRLMTYQPLYVI